MSKSKSAPRRTNDPEKMRGKILDAAADLFQSRGYHDSSVHHIIRAAGVTSGALHHHFATKKDLALAVIQDRVWPAVDEAWIKPVVSASDPIKGIGAAFRAISRDLTKQGFVRGCPLNNLVIELAYADPEFREALKGVFAAWRAALTGKLATFERRPRSRAEAADLANFV